MWDLLTCALKSADDTPVFQRSHFQTFQPEQIILFVVEELCPNYSSVKV